MACPVLETFVGPLIPRRSVMAVGVLVAVVGVQFEVGGVPEGVIEGCGSLGVVRLHVAGGVQVCRWWMPSWNVLRASSKFWAGLQCGGAQVVEGALVGAPVEVHVWTLHPAQVFV